MKFALTIWILIAAAAARADGADSLRCEGRINPLGIDALRPALSWVLTGQEQNIRQLAYQVLVSSTQNGAGDLWNSGKVTSGQSVGVAYAGKPLTSRLRCFWKVRVWTNYGESAWSAAARWTMGLLQSKDWTAQWIGYEHGFPWDSVSKFSRLSARYFRKTFDTKPVTHATLYIVGLGHYEAYLNGQKIGDDVLTQVPTDYDKEVTYRTYDVTDNIEKNNVIGVILGNGRFFTMRPKYKPKKIKEFGFPRLLLQLEITHGDGSETRIVSDGSWTFTADGPIRSNNEYDGEEYDATRELGGWTKTGYDDHAWMHPEVLPAWGAVLKAQTQDPINVVDRIAPVSLKPLNGAWILDMGRNMSGWVQLKVKGKKGDKVTLRFAEALKTDGSLNTANLRDARATDVYTLKGGDTECWRPVFVYHGFQYVSVEGYPGTPTPDDFEGQVVSDGLDTLGTWTSSNDLFNRIYTNACRSIQSDYKYLPLDCPQRNERMPWMADRAAGCLGESFWLDNHRLYAQWMDDIDAAQKPDGSLPDVAPAYWNYYSDNMTWPGTYLMVARMLYTQYGDAGPIRKHYASMRRWLLYMNGRYAIDGLLMKDKYGDWCVPPEAPSLIHAKDPARLTDGTLIATAYDAYFCKLMADFAPLAGAASDTVRWNAMRAQTVAAFNRAYRPHAAATVTADLLPLVFGISGDAAAARADLFHHIEVTDNGHISTGVIGTGWLMDGLTRLGRPDLAYRIADNRDYPGWGYMVEQGATSTWELWNGNTADPSMNSRNHVMLLGDLLTWMYEDLGGIRAAAPGFREIEMRPVCTDSLNHVRASYRTPYGLVTSEWTSAVGVFDWSVRVPPNTSAHLHLPDGSATANGRPIQGGTLTLGSGVYNIHVEKKRL